MTVSEGRVSEGEWVGQGVAPPSLSSRTLWVGWLQPVLPQVDVQGGVSELEDGQGSLTELSWGARQAGGAGEAWTAGSPWISREATLAFGARQAQAWRAPFSREALGAGNPILAHVSRRALRAISLCGNRTFIKLWETPKLAYPPTPVPPLCRTPFQPPMLHFPQKDQLLEHSTWWGSSQDLCLLTKSCFCSRTGRERSHHSPRYSPEGLEDLGSHRVHHGLGSHPRPSGRARLELLAVPDHLGRTGVWV